MKEKMFVKDEVFTQINHWTTEQENPTKRVLDMQSPAHDKDLFLYKTQGGYRFSALKFNHFVAKNIRVREVHISDTREQCISSTNLRERDEAYYTWRFVVKDQYIHYCPNLQARENYWRGKELTLQFLELITICKAQYQDSMPLEIILRPTNLLWGLQNSEFGVITEDTLRSEEFSLKDCLDFLSNKAVPKLMQKKKVESQEEKPKTQIKKKPQNAPKRSKELLIRLEISKSALGNKELKPRKVEPYLRTEMKFIVHSQIKKRNKKLKQSKIISKLTFYRGIKSSKRTYRRGKLQ